MHSAIVKICTVLVILMAPHFSWSLEIALPENELPSESVIPKLDTSTVVLNRTIQKAKHISAGLSYGQLLDEMFYNSQLLSLELRYNISEMGAWGFRWDQWMGGATTYTDTFAADVSQLQFAAAPSRKSGVFILRAFDLYYGKVSLGKETIIPLHMSWLAMVGMQNYESAWLPAVQGGGQLRMYFLKKFALDLQYIFSAYQKVDPTSTNVRASNGIPQETAFSKKANLGQVFQLGVSYLF